MMLPEIDRKKVWRRKKFGSIYEYAAKLAGMSRSSVDEALRVLKKIDDKPALQKIAEEKGIQRVRAVATIATKATQEFWSEKARDMSKHTLETYVKNYRLEILPGEKITGEKAARIKLAEANESEATNKASGHNELIEISMKLQSQTLKKLEQMKGDRSWDELMTELSGSTGSTGSTNETEKPQPVRTKSRRIPVKIKRFAVSQTKGKCAYPGCQRNFEILHHTQRFAIDKVHDPDKIVPLCTAHERLAHLGLIENEEKPPKNWRIRENADRTDYKQFVDQQVWLHR